MTQQATGETAGAVRDRLFETAEELFAERGFAHASVREITAAESRNLAAGIRSYDPGHPA